MDINQGAVQPDAWRALIIAAVGVFVMGFALGPYAIWRARHASEMIEASPWLRGRWHVRAAYLLGALALVQGLVGLAGKYLIAPGGM